MIEVRSLDYLIILICIDLIRIGDREEMLNFRIDILIYCFYYLSNFLLIKDI